MSDAELESRMFSHVDRNLPPPRALIDMQWVHLELKRASPDVKRDAVGVLDSAPEEVMLPGSTVPSTRAKTG